MTPVVGLERHGVACGGGRILEEAGAAEHEAERGPRLGQARVEAARLPRVAHRPRQRLGVGRASERVHSNRKTQALARPTCGGA